MSNQSLLSFFILGYCFISCNKEIRTTYSVDTLDKNRISIIEDEAQKIDNIVGNYYGTIKSEYDSSHDGLRIKLLPNSYFEAVQEDFSEDDSNLIIRGTFTISNDTLTLHHIIESKRFKIQDNKLFFIPEFCPGFIDTLGKDSVVLYKMD